MRVRCARAREYRAREMLATDIEACDSRAGPCLAVAVVIFCSAPVDLTVTENPETVTA